MKINCEQPGTVILQRKYIMKLTISKKGLKDALVNLSKIVSSRASLPILGCVKISGEKDGVKVTGTNLEQTLTCKIKGGEGGGSFIVDLKELKDYLKQGGTTNSTV
jgi:DNA polymerase III sliding clamp (beta) subunit (PCNA family)